MKDPLLPPFTAFERGDTFYDIVTSYSIALAGLKSMFDPNNPMRFELGEAIIIEGKVHSELTADIFELHRHAITRHVSSPPVAQDLACMLIALAYESVRKQNDQSETFEFFRHIRNAAAHGNHFNFSKHEPSRPAQWRGVVLDDSLMGASNPLQGTQCFGGLLGPADPILLLWDVQQKLP